MTNALKVLQQHYCAKCTKAHFHFTYNWCVFIAYKGTPLCFVLENLKVQLSSLTSRLPSEIDDCRLSWPGTESSHSVYSGILQEWIGPGCMVGFVIRCLPDCCSSSSKFKVAVSRREGGEDIFMLYVLWLPRLKPAVQCGPSQQREEGEECQCHYPLKAALGYIFCKTLASLSALITNWKELWREYLPLSKIKRKFFLLDCLIIVFLNGTTQRKSSKLNQWFFSLQRQY